MEKVILIKYGELTTKKDNRKLFIKHLTENIKNKLKDIECKIIKDISRMYIEYKNKDEESILNVLKCTFGLHAYNIAYKVKTDEEEIKKEVLGILKNTSFSTFKVVTKRRDKSFPISSMDFNNVIGGLILKNIKNIKVDVNNPDIYVNIEIDTYNTYIYLNEEKALGGYPVGVLGKGLLMLSGGIDSPVAGYLALKRGVKIDAIYFEAIPHTSINAREKVITLAKSLLKYSNDFNLYVVPITKLQEAIYKNCDPTYIITIRRMMYRISAIIAKKNKSLVLINGESIGQVASQTLTSMNVINEVVNIPVIRPLACMDKLEIIDISKKINTYETSILPYEDCCTIFVPKHPVINPRLDKCLAEEKKLDYESMINEIVKETFKIKITESSSFEDIL